ncbi:hypothetical protein ACTMU2_16815 [Cupriavidus basilensis]
MVHAVEESTPCKHKKNAISDALAREGDTPAFGQSAGCMREPVTTGARARRCCLARRSAGQAFANAPVAAVHALAYPLGGHFHIPHGLSNACRYAWAGVLRLQRLRSSSCAGRLGKLAGALETIGRADVAMTKKLAPHGLYWIHGGSDGSVRCATGGCAMQVYHARESLAMLASDAMQQQRCA